MGCRCESILSKTIMKWLVGKWEMAMGRERSDVAKGTASYVDSLSCFERP